MVGDYYIILVVAMRDNVKSARGRDALKSVSSVKWVTSIRYTNVFLYTSLTCLRPISLGGLIAILNKIKYISMVLPTKFLYLL
jgi:hypothetical protein